MPTSAPTTNPGARAAFLHGCSTQGGYAPRLAFARIVELEDDDGDRDELLELVPDRWRSWVRYLLEDRDRKLAAPPF